VQPVHNFPKRREAAAHRFFWACAACRYQAPENEDQENLQFKKYLAGKKNNNGAPSSSMAELDMYLQEAKIAVNSPSFDILNWWKVNALWFPTLAVLATTILMVPMTSISS
jgi:hypothetical protein